MKSMLISGAVLMAAAGIYGFVDFNQTKNKTAFTKMYEASAPVQETTVSTSSEETLVAAAETKALVATNKAQQTTAVKTKKVIAKVKAKKKEKQAALLTEAKRKLDVRMFSRAPLRDIPDIEETELRKEKAPLKTGKEKSPEN